MKWPDQTSDGSPDQPRPGPWGEDGSTSPLPAHVHRRLTVAVCWAMARREALDSHEHYEDSYALSQEFREWLLCLDDHPVELRSSVLMVPRQTEENRKPETDGLLEI
ncbi:MAG: hypothetical protein ACK5UG_03780 [Synechococcaceae cyanobacterium]|jgi:hypothetical protein